MGERRPNGMKDPVHIDGKGMPPIEEARFLTGQVLAPNGGLVI